MRPSSVIGSTFLDAATTAGRTRRWRGTVPGVEVEGEFTRQDRRLAKARRPAFSRLAPLPTQGM
jgi:hypothetical protein